MNFKAMNMKKGLKRFWIVGSVFWFFYIPANFMPDYADEHIWKQLIIGAVSVGLWWALLYLGFWIARGFVDDDDKKAGF